MRGGWVPGRAAQRLILSGVDVLTPNPFWAAEAWADANPDDPGIPCCDGSAYDPRRCTCWVPVYDTEQRPIVPVDRPELLLTQTTMCGDCAYRRDSPERADDYTEEELLALPSKGSIFWCHEGMRRPSHWLHPDGRTIPGHPGDYHPTRRGNFLYQGDGSPALLCAGWLWRRLRYRERVPVTADAWTSLFPAAE